MTVGGEVRPARAYYHCRHCGRGQVPRDTRWGLSACDLSRGAARAIALTGTLARFAEAATEVLPKRTGRRVCESTVERTTERAGPQGGQRLATGETVGSTTSWNGSKDAEGKTCADVAADLTGVGMPGEGGAKTGGRMAAVGMIWNGGEEGRVRYVCGRTGGLAALGQPRREQATQVDMHAAERRIALPDGGAGIEDWLRVNFPRAEAIILDFDHAAEHPSDGSKVLWPQESEAKREGHAWCHRLRHEGGAVVLAALRGVDVSHRSAEVREALRKLVGDFANPMHRMDDPSYRAKGWLTGSGPVEAACQQVVNQRLTCSGMRWSESGADAVCHLRALFRCGKGQWDACWSSLAA